MDTSTVGTIFAVLIAVLLLIMFIAGYQAGKADNNTKRKDEIIRQQARTIAEQRAIIGEHKRVLNSKSISLDHEKGKGGNR